MSDKLERKINPGKIGAVKALAIVAAAWGLISPVWHALVYNLLLDFDLPFSFFVNGRTVVWTLVDTGIWVLLLVYLFGCYHKNRDNKLLPIYFLLQATMSVRTLVTNARIVEDYSRMRHYSDLSNINYIEGLMHMVYALLAIHVFLLFAVDAFCKFRLAKVSRVLAVVLLATLVTIDLVWMVMYLSYWSWGYFILYIMPSILMGWLGMLCYLLFYFCGVKPAAAQEESAPACDPVAVPTYAPVAAPAPVAVPAYAPVAAPAPVAVPTYVPVAYVPVAVPTYVPAPAPVPVPAPVTEPTHPRFCTQCGSPLHGAFCSNCGKG